MRAYRNQVIAGLVFITAALVAVIAFTGVDELAGRLGNFPLWLFGPVLLLKCANWVLRYLEWRYFLGVIGVRTVRGLRQSPPPNPAAPVIRERDSAILWLAGLTLAVSPGKLGEVLKAVVLKYLTGVEFTRSAPVIFMERLVDGLAVIPLTTVALLALGGAVNAGDVSLGYVRTVLIAVSVVLAVGMVLVQIKPLAYGVLDFLRRWPMVGRLHGALLALYESSYDLIKPRHLAITVLFGLGAYTTDCIGFFILLRGLGVEGGWTLFAQATFILGFSVIIASISTLPGGAGGRELTIGPLLIHLVGLEKGLSGTATLLIGLFQLWAGVLLGLVLIALFSRVLFPPALEQTLADYRAARAQSRARG